MAKKLKAPIDYIINRIYGGRCYNDCEWNMENFRTSIEQHPCDANMAILKALDNDDDDYLMFTIEHLIHIRYGYIPQCYEAIQKAKKFNWRS